MMLFDLGVYKKRNVKGVSRPLDFQIYLLILNFEIASRKNREKKENQLPICGLPLNSDMFKFKLYDELM
jgi:hypothetical protein